MMKHLAIEVCALTYCYNGRAAVDALRTLMIVGEISHFGLGLDFAVSLLTFGALLAIATPIFPRVLY